MGLVAGADAASHWPGAASSVRLSQSAGSGAGTKPGTGGGVEAGEVRRTRQPFTGGSGRGNP